MNDIILKHDVMESNLLGVTLIDERWVSRLLVKEV